jgi:hypothetical protein
MVETLRKALANDPIFQPDKTGKGRSTETIVLDAWGYQVRDFPIVVVTGVPGSSRRAGINDKVRPFFGVALTEDPVSGTDPNTRTFDVPLILNVDTEVEVRYVGDPATDPAGPWQTLVKEKVVGSTTVRYVEITGTSVGPASTYPLSKFEASTKKVATGEVYGGWYDMTVEITAGARSTQSREILADRLWLLLWFEKKRELRRKGIVVLDVRHSGVTQADYGADKVYFSKFAVSVATEFEAIAQYTETVEAVGVEGVAVESMP